MADLTTILTTNTTAEAIVKTLAARKRNSAQTEVDLVVDLPEVARTGSRFEVRRNAIAFFRDLETMDVGQLVIGRRGKNTRFVWKRPLIEFAGDALRVLETPDTSSASTTRAAARAQSSPTVGPPSLIKHSFVLRRDVTVSFELPDDFTASEAERLTSLIKAIPFVHT